MALASATLDRARRLILDETSVRWPLPELVMWLNDGLREIALQKPTATAAPVVIPLIRGTRQAVPPVHTALMRVTRNMRPVVLSAYEPSRAIAMVAREILDTQTPNWHDPVLTPYRPTVRNAAFDAADPLAFWVYPGNDGNGFAEIVVSRVPNQVPTAGDVLTAYDVALDLNDVYLNALLDYVLYRAFSKDAQYAGNINRAGLHFQQFAQSLGVKVRAETMANPNVSQPAKPQGSA